MGTTASTIINVLAYPPGTIPPVDTATALFDQSGNSGRSPAAPTVENDYYPAGLGDNISGKFFTDAETSISTPVLGNNQGGSGFQNKTTAAILIYVSQHSNPRVESRHTRCEIGETRLQYFSRSRQRWIEVVATQLVINATPEDRVGGSTTPDAFAIPPKKVSVRAGTNARNVAGTFTGRTNNGQGTLQNVGYRVQGAGNRFDLPWNDAEVVLAVTPMRTVGPGSTDAVPKYIGASAVEAWEGQSGGAPGFGATARYKPITSAWQNFTTCIGPTARLTTDPPFGSANNPFPTDVVLSGNAPTYTELRTKIREAIAAQPTGALNLRIFPANAVVSGLGSMTLDAATDGINGTRAIGLDWSNLTMAGGAGNWDKPFDRLPVFGQFNAGGVGGVRFDSITGRIKFIIRTDRILQLPANQRYSLDPLPPTIKLAIRTSWGMIRADMELPDTSVAGQVSWSFNQQMSDYLKAQADALGGLFTVELAPNSDPTPLAPAHAAWILYNEPVGSNEPALVLQSVSNFKMYGLNIRDRTIANKNYWITQTGDVFARQPNGDSLHRTTFGYDRIPTTGIRVLLSSNVAIEDCLFFNLDGDAVSTDISTNNYDISRNTFHEIGCNALVHGTLFAGDGYLTIPYGVNGLFERNLFYRVGLNQINGSPIFGSGNVNLTIRRNIIKSCAYSGITMGYPIFIRGTDIIPQYFTNQVSNADIDGNLIDGAMLRNVDGGGIYLLGPNVGGQLRNNSFRNIGTPRFDVNAPGPFYGTYIGVGQNNVYPANVSQLYYDNGSFGWAASNNAYDTPINAEIIRFFLQTNAGNVEGNADPTLTAGVGVPNIAYTNIPLATVPPLVNGIADRVATFTSYGVAP